MPNEDTDHCRLCGADTRFLFCQRVLHKHDVCYHRCPACDLIQSENPWWLGEAYTSAINSFDTGAIARNLRCADLSFVAASLLGVTPASKCADVGGGHGVFVRMMRDRGLNFHLCDKYAENLYARGFEADPSARFDFVTCFEVFEHFADVAGEMERLFAPRHDALLVSTVLHRGHREGWWYYGPSHGQHIAFYSRQTIRFVAERYGYRCIAGGAYTLFIREGVTVNAAKRSLLRKVILRSRADRNSKWVRSLSVLVQKHAPLTSTDSEALLAKRRAAA